MAIPSEAVSALIRAQTRVSEAKSLAEKLTAIAEGIVDCQIFRRALVTVYPDTPLGYLRGAAGISAGELEWLDTHGHDSRYYRGLATKGDLLVKDCFFISHSTLTEEDISGLLASRKTEEAFVSWHPDDMFLVLLSTPTAGHIGNLTCDDPTSGAIPSKDEAQIISIFTNEVGHVLEAEVARRIDGLTDLANDAWVSEELSRLDETGEAFSLVFCAIRDTEGMSERFGRRYRDEAVKAVARAMRRVTPRGAWCARSHGDEFIAVVKGVEPARIEFVRDNLERAIAQWNETELPEALKTLGLHQALANDPLSHIRLRFGTATRREDESSYSVLSRADKAARKDRSE